MLCFIFTSLYNAQNCSYNGVMLFTVRNPIEEKMAALPSKEELASDDQIAAYHRNVEKIKKLQEGIFLVFIS